MASIKQAWADRTFARFLVSGALNTTLTYVLFLAVSVVLHHALAYTICYVIGVTLAYVMSISFVFRQPYTSRSVALFPLVYIGQFLYGLVALAVLVDMLSIRSSIAMAVVIVTSLPLTFLLSRRAVSGVARRRSRALRPRRCGS